MIIAKDFVMVNMQKTGTTYANNLARIYNNTYIYGSDGNFFCRAAEYSRFRKGPFIKRLIYMILDKSYLYCRERISFRETHNLFSFEAHKHHGCSKIPLSDRHKEVVSVLRDPYNQMISWYCWSVQHKWLGVHERDFNQTLKYCVRERVPELAGKTFGVNSLDVKIGLFTYHFIRMFFKAPGEILTMSEKAFNDYFDEGEYKKDMHKVKFFRLETLSEQLHEYLKNKPYIDGKILNKTFACRSRIDRNRSKRLDEEYWTEENKAYFEKTERLYIQMVKEFAPLPQDQAPR